MSQALGKIFTPPLPDRLRPGRVGRVPVEVDRGPRPGSIARAVSTFNLERLDNGLRILTAPMDSAQSVTCAIMLAAGSRYETPETNGIAHFAEHMFFKGTEKRPTARDISMEIDGIGGEFNAFTGKEYTGYYVKCAAESRDIALDVLVDMLRHSKFDPDEIEREKGVIIEEMNMYYDTPRDFIGGVYEELLYDDQPLGWDIIGRKETIRGAKRETFNGYVDHWYKPSRMVVGVGGKVGDGLHERLQALLGDMEEAETGRPEPVKVDPHDHPHVKVHTKASDQAHICLGVHSYPLEHPDRYALQVLATVLGGRNVVEALHRGARAAWACVLRLRAEPQLHGCRLALRAGRSRHQPHRRRRQHCRGRAAQDG